MLARAFGIFFTFAGIMHFVRPGWYSAILPGWLPAHTELVYASGVAEMAGGLMVLNPSTRRAGSALSIATLLAIFPANVDMAFNSEDFDDIPEALLWARLPLQAAFIAWAWAAGEWDEER
ncbi:DoxX family protein [soil metagenome]